MPSPEEEFTTTYIVKVRSYGRPDKVRGETDKALGRALHFAFHDRFEYQRDGKKLVYDQFAMDGEHVGHDTPVTTVTTVEPTEAIEKTIIRVFRTTLSSYLKARMCPTCRATVMDEFKSAHMEWHEKMDSLS